MSATPVLADLAAGADTHRRTRASPRPRLSLVVGLGVAAGLLAIACGGSSGPTEDNFTATIGGVSWHTPGRGFIITGSDGSTNFTLQGATLLPNSPLIDSSKPQLLIVFPQVPSAGTYAVEGVTVVVQYQVDTNTIYSASTGSVQITSISASRAQGAFNFDLYSPTADPTVLTMTDGAFDVPVSGH